MWDRFFDSGLYVVRSLWVFNGIVVSDISLCASLIVLCSLYCTNMLTQLSGRMSSRLALE